MTSDPEVQLDRNLGRSVFGRVVFGCDRVHSDCPAELYERLARRCGGVGDKTVFEIGPGTGLAMRDILAAGALHASFPFVRSLNADAREALLDGIETIVIVEVDDLMPSPVLTLAYFAAAPKRALQ